MSVALKITHAKVNKAAKSGNTYVDAFGTVETGSNASPQKIVAFGQVANDLAKLVDKVSKDTPVVVPVAQVFFQVEKAMKEGQKDRKIAVIQAFSMDPKAKLEAIYAPLNGVDIDEARVRRTTGENAKGDFTVFMTGNYTTKNGTVRRSSVRLTTTLADQAIASLGLDKPKKGDTKGIHVKLDAPVTCNFTGIFSEDEVPQENGKSKSIRYLQAMTAEIPSPAPKLKA